jgi:hypothetical protein
VYAFTGPHNIDSAVISQQQLGCPQLAIVLKSHRMRVGTGIMNNEEITSLDVSWEIAAGTEPVVVLAQSADDVGTGARAPCAALASRLRRMAGTGTSIGR